MKQQPIKLWYDKKEPTVQIEILKSIALNSYQSTTTLIKTLGEREILDNKTGITILKEFSITTINTVIGKMNDNTHDLIQPHRKEQIKKGKAPHTMFSLTEKGIRILLGNQFEESNKPYLEPKELVVFINRFKEDYITQKLTKEYPRWQSPKLTEKNIMDSYIKSNPDSKDGLAKEYQKYNSKLGGLINKAKEYNQKLKDTQDEITKGISEAIVFQLKK